MLPERGIAEYVKLCFPVVMDFARMKYNNIGLFIIDIINGQAIYECLQAWQFILNEGFQNHS